MGLGLISSGGGIAGKGAASLGSFGFGFRGRRASQKKGCGALPLRHQKARGPKLFAGRRRGFGVSRRSVSSPFFVFLFFSGLGGVVGVGGGAVGALAGTFLYT